MLELGIENIKCFLHNKNIWLQIVHLSEIFEQKSYCFPKETCKQLILYALDVHKDDILNIYHDFNIFCYSDKNENFKVIPLKDEMLIKSLIDGKSCLDFKKSCVCECTFRKYKDFLDLKICPLECFNLKYCFSITEN